MSLLPDVAPDSAIEAAVRVLTEEVGRARGEGRAVLTEAELYPVLEALGMGVPAWRVVDGEEGAAEAEGLPGSKVVVKLLSPSVPHRTEVGGVRVVPRTAGDVSAAIHALSLTSPDPAARFLLAEWVAHDTETGGELLLGGRWTEDFGAVVTLGLGGVASELLAKAGGLVRIFSAAGTAVPALEGALEGDALTVLATGSFRGRTPRVERSALARVISAFGALAARVLPELLVELEMNPVVVRDGRLVALDALARVAPQGTHGRGEPPALSTARREGIQRILAPGTVGVVGVSSRMNPGRTVVQNLLHAGFPAEDVQIVKPGSDTLDGCRCVPDVGALDPPVDLLVVAVGAEDVAPLLEAVVRGRRARSVILIPGGLGEGGTEERGVALSASVRAAQQAGVVVSGGNCLGVRSVPGRCDTLFIPGAKLGFHDGAPHPVALVTQSGAFAIARASRHPWLNPRHIVTVGNQVDLTVGEYVEALAEDQGTRVVACYVEGFRPLDGARVARAARRLRSEGRLLLLLRGGRTPQGAQAAVSHTASVAGEYAVTRALVEEAGGVVAESLERFDDLLMLGTLLASRDVDGARLGAVSNAGFECVVMADAAEGLSLPAPSPPTVEALSELLAYHRLDGIVAPRNPLDLTPILGDEAFTAAARMLLEDREVDVGVVGCVPLTPALQTLEAGNPLDEDLHGPGGVLERLGELWRGTRKAWVAVVDGGVAYDAFAQGLATMGIPVFRRADTAVAALARYVAWRLG